MALDVGLQTGLVTGLVQGLGSIYGGYPADGAALAAAMGFANAPTSYWLFTATSGAETDLVNGNTLTPFVGQEPTQGVSDSALGAITAEFADASVQRMEAANNTVLDITTGDMGIVLVGRYISGVGGDDDFVTKRTGGQSGYDLYTSSSGRFVIFQTEDDLGANTNGIIDLGGTGATNLSNGDPFVMVCGVDTNAGTTHVHIRYQGTTSSNTGSAPASTITSSQVFTVGGRVSTGNWRIAALAVWNDDTAQGLAGTHAAALAAFLGFE